GQLDVVGDDVVAHAAVDGAEGQHHRLVADVHLAADDGLRLGHDLGRGNDRIYPAPGPGAVGLAADDAHVERVRGGHGWPGTLRELVRVEGAEDVQAEHRGGPEALEDDF